MLNSNLPLGLPRGSVRAVISLAVIGVALAKWYLDGDIPSELLAIVGTVIGFYFGGRQSANTGGG